MTIKPRPLAAYRPCRSVASVLPLNQAIPRGVARINPQVCPWCGVAPVRPICPHCGARN